MSDVAELLAEHDSWLTVERGLAKNTLVSYRRDLAGYARFLAARGVNAAGDIRPETVEAYVAHLRAEVTPEGAPRYKAASIARALVAVRSFHAFLAAEGQAASDPAEDVAGPRVPQGIPKALTEEEVLALLDAVSGDEPMDHRDRAILELLYGTGLRISELVGLDLGAIDIDERFLRAFGKGSKERVVPMGRAAAEAVRAWLPPRLAVVAAAKRPQPDALFLNPRGQRLTRQGAWLVIRRHGLRAGLGERLSPHVLRHSCATHMVDHGADLRVVQELLGHASVSTTQVYTKVTQSRLRAVYDAAHPRSRAGRNPNAVGLHSSACQT